jgi:SAM-dependent methyltransferase
MAFISFHDFAEVYREAIRSSPAFVLSRLRLSGKAAVSTAWDKQEFPNKNWSAIKKIVESTNAICTGDPQKEYLDYIIDKYLRKRSMLTALSIGSGRGILECEWAKSGLFRELTGIDISPKSVEAADNLAARENLHEVKFMCADISKRQLPELHYDIVFSHAALHHLKPIDNVIRKIWNCLKPGGLFLVDEYVGPRRLQYTRKQLDIANKLLREIPVRYRKRWRLGSIKNEAHHPGLLRMILSDQSEAVESDKILPVLGGYFKPLEMALRGGTILCPLFHDIGHNFADDDPVGNEIVQKCIEVERELIEKKEIGCDYIIGLYEKKQNPETPT